MKLKVILNLIKPCILHTIEEIIDYMDVCMHAEVRSMLNAETSPVSTLRLHSTLGRDIRNKFCLWNYNNVACRKFHKENNELYHPDSVSQYIINELVKRIRMQNGLDVKPFALTQIYQTTGNYVAIA